MKDFYIKKYKADKSVTYRRMCGEGWTKDKNGNISVYDAGAGPSRSLLTIDKNNWDFILNKLKRKV